MSVSTAQPRSITAEAGWLRSPAFDLNLIVVIALAALACGALALAQPELFGVILVLDLWLLGYHHVASTFTRLCFDKESFKEHRFLVIELPIIVIACTIAAVFIFGSWVLPTTYLYWQWFHYTRQSYGIERMYRRKAPEGTRVHDYFTTRSTVPAADVRDSLPVLAGPGNIPRYEHQVPAGLGYRTMDCRGIGSRLPCWLGSEHP